jgi:hypothetical protein
VTPIKRYVSDTEAVASDRVAVPISRDVMGEGQWPIKPRTKLARAVFDYELALENPPDDVHRPETQQVIHEAGSVRIEYKTVYARGAGAGVLPYSRFAPTAGEVSRSELRYGQ